MEALPEEIREEFCPSLSGWEEGEQAQLFRDWLEGRLHRGEATRRESTCARLAWRALKQGRLADASKLLGDVEVPGGIALKGP